MELFLNSILNLTQAEIENSKIEFNMQAGSGGQIRPSKFDFVKEIRTKQEQRIVKTVPY